MKILLVDDHPTFRDGLKFLLSSLAGDLEFFDANSLECAVEYRNTCAIELILLDLCLPGVSGLDAVRELKAAFPESTLVILSGVEDEYMVTECIDLGAAGYIPKSSTQPVLISALQLVLSGGIYVPPSGVFHRAAISPQQACEKLKVLSARQRDALARALQGKPYKIIAREMGIAESTVKVHLSTAYHALGVANRTGAVFLLGDPVFRSALYAP